MLSTVMMSVVLLNVDILNVVILNVVAPLIILLIFIFLVVGIINWTAWCLFHKARMLFIVGHSHPSLIFAGKHDNIPFGAPLE
jgi:hypothetical protein